MDRGPHVFQPLAVICFYPREIKFFKKKRRKKCVKRNRQSSLLNYERFSDINQAIWVVSRILAIMKNKSFSGGKTTSVSAQLLLDADNLIVKDAQNIMQEELVKTDQKGKKGGRYATLNPVLSKNGHRGRDATLAKFREKYWVRQGSKLARKGVQNCQLCKYDKQSFYSK